MKFVLFRHAHKGVQPFDDPELSLPGFEQAAKLVDLVNQKTLPVPTKLLVSPRRRTSQTFYPLSKNFSVPLEINKDLDQSANDEYGTSFKKRIEGFLADLSTTDDSQAVVFACTHYDWIEHAMVLINCDKDLNSFDFSHWSPTQFIEFDVTPGVWKFIKKGSAK